MSNLRPGRIRLALFVVTGVGAAALAFTAYFTGILRSQELSTVDVRFSLRGPGTQPQDVVVVQIDGQTFSDLQQRWPFPRSLHARVIDRLRKDGAKAIAYDIQFTEPSVPREDNALIDAVGRARNVVLATTEVDAAGHTNIFGGDAVLRQVHARAGNAVYQTDAGGVIRRMQYSIDKLKAFPVAAAEVELRRPINASALGGRSAWIDYAGPPGTIQSLSFSKVLRGRFPPGTFRGKVVVVGPSAPSLQDVHPTSASGSKLMSGAEIEANAVETALRGFPLRSYPRAANYFFVILLALLPVLSALKLPPLRSLLLVLALGAAYAGAVQLAFDHGRVIWFVYPLLALVLSAVGSLAVSYLLTAFERERTRDLFARFVPENVVDQVLAQTGNRLRLGGRRIVCTVMFSDVRGFTSFSEGREAEDVIEFLNRYLTEMSDAILDHGGTLVAYMGDGIMAVFGAPIGQDDHADRALAAAREMLEKRLPAVNDWLRERGEDVTLRMGIGLNSGPTVSGNVGSERRLEYTTIGDTTNTASRLESMTKGSEYSLFVAESTRELLRYPESDLVFVDELEVRGRSAPVKVWALPEPVPQEEPIEAAPGLAPA